MYHIMNQFNLCQIKNINANEMKYTIHINVIILLLCIIWLYQVYKIFTGGDKWTSYF